MLMNLYTQIYDIPSDLTFTSWIYFKLIFVSIVKYGPNFILQHMGIQFSQNHLLRRLSFPIVLSWCWSKISWLCMWTLYSVALVYTFVFTPVPYCFEYYSFVIEFEIEKCDTCNLDLLSQDCFGSSGSFVFWHKFCDSFFTISVKNVFQIPKMEFWYRLCWICRLLWVVWRFWQC